MSEEIRLGPDGELPPGFHFIDPPGSFREFLADNGEDRPDADSEPAAWVAWYLDASGDETYDVNDGPREDDWPEVRDI